MSINRKATLFTVGLATVLVVALATVSLYSFRQYSITFATEQVRTSAEIVRLNLTEAMINGTIDKRDSFLRRLNDIAGFESAHVVPSPALIRQFGAQAVNGKDRQPDAIERQVMATAKPAYTLLSQNGETLFRGTIPYIASERGTPNCMQCHQVEEGTVLGTVSIVLSIESLKHQALLTVGMIVLVVLFFSVAIVLTARRLVAPIAETAGDVERAVQLALDGNFQSYVKPRTKDEVGNIAGDFNRLLGVLGDGLGRIAESVSQLINRKPVPGENQINATIEMVEILTRASHFKQAIEEDETRDEIHKRLAHVLENEFFVNEYSLYEVLPVRDQMKPLIVDGVNDASCRWCNPEILVRNESCRARRTGHLVDGVTSPGICYAFQPPPDAANRMHICIPIMQSGTVGNVLQIVTGETSAALHGRMLPFINVYLREAAPVIESKRLMETLRDSNLRDPMTGLNNRRFVEEYVDTLLASTQRHKAHLAILMLDLDYFKMVNDNYGHDAGDAVLKALAKTLRLAVRASDLVIRYGGEEFLIILPETDAEVGALVAENIRAEVEKLKVPLTNGTVLQKTISIGVADFPEDSTTFWQAVKFADVALYRAKDEGRNRVVRFTTDMWDDKKEY
jgi:diguanylate cyclase (GGDEF)-like protein